MPDKTYLDGNLVFGSIENKPDPTNYIIGIYTLY